MEAARSGEERAGKEIIVAELPENPGTEGSLQPQAGAPAPPPFQPVATQYQPVAAPPQPTAAPARSGGSNALKIILIIVAIFVFLVILVVGAIGYVGWRVSRAVHVNNKAGETTITTPGGTFSANSSETFTAAELGTDIYPGAQPAKGGMRMSLPTGSVVAANYTTSDSKDQVVAFYKSKLGSEVTTMDLGTSAIVTLKKGNQAQVTVTIEQKPETADGKTQIHIMHTTDNQAK